MKGRPCWPHCKRDWVVLRRFRKIREIRIFSEKHGSDYHPAKIEVQLQELVVPFVMNVALSSRGRQVLANEFKVLDTLRGRHRPSYLPPAHFLDRTPPGFGPQGTPVLLMYLADWLEGFMSSISPSIRPMESRN